ncbi:MAG: hypothetical protein K5930_13480 [Treponemataceae bacterium]|nr:hypothetical protein [Treponemataceae bacterium]
MTINEIDEEIEKARARQKSFQTNRTLSGLVVVFLCYEIYKTVSEESTALWFFIVMGLFIAVALFLVIFDTKRINQAKAELETLEKEKEAFVAELDDAYDSDDGEGDDDKESSEEVPLNSDSPDESEAEDE